MGDKILTCPPTYGMYAVSADVNDIAIVHVPLNPDDNFSLQPDAILSKLSEDPSIKLVYICSPGNPTASLISKSDIQRILEHPTWNGIVVVDEAYIDFAPDNSSPTSAIATAALKDQSLTIMRNNRAKILEQRDRLLKELPTIPGVGRFRGGTDSNFLLVEILDK